jgi:hypothetical protein
VCTREFFTNTIHTGDVSVRLMKWGWEVHARLRSKELDSSSGSRPLLQPRLIWPNYRTIVTVKRLTLTDYTDSDLFPFSLIVRTHFVIRQKCVSRWKNNCKRNTKRPWVTATEQRMWIYCVQLYLQDTCAQPTLVQGLMSKLILEAEEVHRIVPDNWIGLGVMSPVQSDFVTVIMTK